MNKIMDQQLKYVPKPKENSSKMVVTVLENMKNDIALSQYFLCQCLDTYECCPKTPENELVCDVLGDFKSLNSSIAESDKSLKVIAKAWSETINYFKEFLNLEDNHENLNEIKHPLLEFCRKAEHSTKVEQNLIRDVQKSIGDIEKAVCNISKDMKTINCLKQEIQCETLETLNEVNKHEETLNYFLTNLKDAQIKQAGLKHPGPMPARTNRSPVNTSKSPASTSRSPASTSKHHQDDKSGVDQQPQRMAMPTAEKEVQWLHIEGTPKRIEDIVTRFDQMSTKARQELKKTKDQDEVLQKTVAAIRKSQGALEIPS